MFFDVFFFELSCDFASEKKERSIREVERGGGAGEAGRYNLISAGGSQIHIE